MSHHPPISCWHARGQAPGGSYIFTGEVELRSKFWGKSVEMTPTGEQRLIRTCSVLNSSTLVFPVAMGHAYLMAKSQICVQLTGG